MSLSGMSLQNVGRYQITGELGKGAMGVVYKATDPTIGRTVALKTMRLDVHGIDAEEMLKRFRNEARAAGVLNHPNIVTIYDAGETEGLFYIAMECIEGYTLHSLLAERRVIPVDQVIELSRQVCAGLDYAHSHGVIHRDVKPANIMITPDQTVKIMDFGIAKAGGGLTSAGQVLGTPNYMSPEQVKGRTLDGRSDLFSWGVILYEMITGEKPFTGQNVTTIIYKIVNENPIPPRELDVTIHPGLSMVVTRALAKPPDERYQKGSELVQELRNYKSLGAPVEPTTAFPAAGETKVPEEPVAEASAESSAAPVPSAAPAPQPPAPPAAKPPAPAAKKAAPAPPPSSKTLRPAAAAASPQQKLLVPVGALVLVLVLALAGFAWYRHRAAQRQSAETAAQDTAQQPPSPQPAPATAVSQPPADQPAESTQAAAGEEQPAAKPAPRKPKTPAPAPVPAASAGTAADAAAATGDLELVSTPDGASLQIDGRSQSTWTTPYTAKDLSAGTHSVSFAKPGYGAVTRSVEVVGGKKTTINVQLAANPNLVSVSSRPAGGAIFVDGRDTGKVTPAQVALDRSEHKLLVRKAGYKDAATTVPRLNPGDSYNYAPTLEPEPAASQAQGKPGSSSGGGVGGFLKRHFGGIPEGKGAIDVKSQPKGAEISISGMPDTHLTPHKYFLDPGTYHLTIKLSGYKTVKKSVTVAKGESLELNEPLQKQ